MDSEDEDYYYTDEDPIEDVETDDGMEEQSDDRQSKKNYTILNESEIKARQEDDISTVSGFLSVSRSAACALLCRYNWTISDLYEEWFADEERVRTSVGVPNGAEEKNQDPSQKLNPILCGICFEPWNPKSMRAASCGTHLFCTDCMKMYVSTSIQDGPGCLHLRCPEPRCESILGFELVESLASDEEKEKYCSFVYRSYVEGCRVRKWCPAPGCGFAVQFDDDGTEKSCCDVACECSYRFCWNCGEESHSPVDCGTVGEWIKKNESEAGNTEWILAYTKPCPKCKRAIEKNQGCNHMVCKGPCRHHFCWVCLGDWMSHGGSFYKCNRYVEKEKDDIFVGEEKSRTIAKRHLERYMHYYERWDANSKGRNKVLEYQKVGMINQITNLARDLDQPETNFVFVIDAWHQIEECRRVLKWAYAYGYYIPTNEKRKIEFFEFLQGQAESTLEKLHHFVETEIKNFLGRADVPLEDFWNFRTNVVNLTSVTRKFFENLVEALENGLAEVENVSRGKEKGESNDLESDKYSTPERPECLSEIELLQFQEYASLR